MYLGGIRRVSRRVVAGVVLAVAMVGASIAPAGPASGQSDELEVGEISHSDNIRHLANVPRQGPLEAELATDMAFWGNYLIQGSYGGFTIYDIRHPHRPEIISQVYCPGGQGDVSVSPDGTLVFVSVDAARSDASCESGPSTPADPDAWEGIRVFDITDVANPDYVTSVRTDCGSHTHTLVPDDSGEVVWLYVSSYGPSPDFPDCQPPHDSISIVEVALDNPADASVVAMPVLGGSWSAYWYNGHIYSSDITEGLDVLRINGPEVAGARRVRQDHFNPQTQYSLTGS